MLAGTIVTRAQLPQARVLANSLCRQHPGAELMAVVMDGRDVSEGFATLTPTDLAFGPDDWDRLVGCHGVDDLASGLKPFLLRELLARARDAGEAGVALLDPGMHVVGQIDEAYRRASEHGLAFIPSSLTPSTGQTHPRMAHGLASAGPINEHAIWLGSQADLFITHWTERVMSPGWNGRVADRAWLAAAPITYEAHVIADAGYGVSLWNLPERRLRRASNATVFAGDHPLRLIDFDRCDPERPWLVGEVADHRLAEDDILSELLQRYAGELRSARRSSDPAAHELDRGPGGVQLLPVVRRAFRRSCEDATDLGHRPPPSPIGGNARAFLTWMRAPVMGPARLGLGPVERELWLERPDLQSRFPDPGGADSERFRDELAIDTSAQAIFRELETPMAPDAGASPPMNEPPELSAHARRHGWNLIGPASADSEAGEAVRRMAAAFDRAAILNRTVNVRPPEDALRVPVWHQRLMAHSLFCAQPDQLLSATVLSAPVDAAESADRGRRIAMWFWDVPHPPNPASAVWANLDEIWCPSRFTANAVATRAPIRVRVIPVPATPAPWPTPFRRSDVGLPDGFVFSFDYSFGAGLARKNPVGVIEAYLSAFGPADGAHLVLRSSDGRHHPEALARVRWAARRRPDVHVTDGALTADRRQAMIQLSDCYVSLHRAEAFGDAMATAMAAGRPVIATGYSGNMDFMDDRSAYLVPYALTPVGPGNAPYPETAVWAEPDLHAAAGLMRVVFDAPDRAREIGMRGAQRVETTHSEWQSAVAIARALDLTLPRRQNPNS